MPITKLETVEQAAQDECLAFPKPLTLVISRSIRNQAVGIALITFSLMCLFAIVLGLKDDNWIAPAILGIIFLYDSSLVIKYWNSPLVPVVQFVGEQMTVLGLTDPIDLKQVIAFDYKYAMNGMLIFKLAYDPSIPIVKRQLSGCNLTINKKDDYLVLKVFLSFSCFQILGEQLTGEQQKQRVNSYLEQIKAMPD